MLRWIPVEHEVCGCEWFSSWISDDIDAFDSLGVVRGCKSQMLVYKEMSLVVIIRWLEMILVLDEGYEFR